MLFEEMGSSEFTEWKAYAKLEPFGSPVEDLRAGIGAAMTANVNRGASSDPVSPLDFFPWQKEEEEPQTREELEAAIKKHLIR